jgi:1,4-alpha-glucan branching enzyme
VLIRGQICLSNARKPESLRRGHNLAQFSLAEPEHIPSQSKLPNQIRLENSRIVRAQRNWHSGVEKPAHGMNLDRTHRPGLHVTGNTNLKRNPLLPQTPHQIGIVHGANPVANPFRAHAQRCANGIGPVGLPRMSGQPQPRIFRIAEGLPQQQRGTAPLIAADPKRNHAVAHVIRRQARDLHHMIQTELPDRVQIPPDLHRPFVLRLALGLPNRPPHGIKIKSAPQNDARAQRNLGIADPLASERFDHAPGDQTVIRRSTQTCRDKFETIEKPGETIERPEVINLLPRERRIEQQHRLAIHGTLKMQVKLAQSHIIEVPMTAPEMEAIIGGYHGDPFSVLGPHPINKDSGSESEWRIRAFLPQARSARVLIGDNAPVPMNQLHLKGLYEVELPARPETYRFEIEGWHGGTSLLDDPYRFPPIITEFDLYLHGEGTLYEAWQTFGAHLSTIDGVAGVRFAVWAPNAEAVLVAGDFNEWDVRRHPMRSRNSGVWEIFIPGAKEGDSYKYFVRSKHFGHRQFKADPFGFRSEVPPKSASVVYDLDDYQWRDSQWMEERAASHCLTQPVSIYEVHLESWMRLPSGESLSYRELAIRLVEYVKRMGYTHIELLPIQEFPFSGSWGYQVTGYFAPTARFGEPADFMAFVDACHEAGIGVIMDWVPAHFPKDAHGLASFDGTALYEHADPRQGEHLDWGTLIFNFGRNEVREFLIASALFWLKKYHIDGLRVDAVASMLYLDYSRKEGEWIPNVYGGRENLEAISFLRRFNELAHEVPGAITIAEESTAFPAVSRPVYTGGLGFTMKWNMGWMHDMLHYFSEDPVYRKYHHNNITFSMLYAFTENFVLPISHDEVVYGKRSVLSKMPGDEWQRFANLRAFLAYMYAHPGKKLLFMGTDIADYNEWNHDASLPWEVLQYPLHAGVQTLVRELNRIYRSEPALYQVDFDYSGFEWIDISDIENSVISFLRRGSAAGESIIFACNFTPVPREKYTIGVPHSGFYREILNTDSALFGGTNMGNSGGLMAKEQPSHGRPYRLSITLPPLAVVALKCPIVTT